MSTINNYYDILGVNLDATQEEIKKSFQRKIRQEHPDKSQEENKQKIASQLIEAYKILSDPNSRNDYDKLFEQQHLKANKGQCFDQINLDQEINYIDHECEQCGETTSIEIDQYNRNEDYVIVECIGCNLKLQINIK